MAFLDDVMHEGPDVRGQWSEARRRFAAGIGWVLYALGWVVAKSLRLVAYVFAAVFYGIGWLGGTVVWPALCWCGRATALGWADGREPARRMT